MSKHTVFIISLGCAKNLVDSEVMLGKLQEKNFQIAGSIDEAELIVINTCGFLQSAVTEAIDKILEAAQYKKTGSCKKLVIAGCMVERYRDELKNDLPEVDAFLSVNDILNVDLDVQTSQSLSDPNHRVSFLYDNSMTRVLSSGGHLAYVKIADGCNRPCAFCIIPKLRGFYRSRGLDSVMREIVGFIENGVKEINLIAQDTTNYGKDLEGQTSIHDLLDEISKLSVGDDYWVRLMYAYPLGINERLIKQMRDNPHVCNYIDLPLQHISSKMLRAMKRPFDEVKTKELVQNMKRWNPELSLRTTFIVGFPGETEEDIALLGDFIAEGHFDHVGVFAYSPEEEAAAFKLGDNISEAEKQQRVKHIMLCQQKVVQKKLSALVGTTQKVLIEGFHPETDLLLAGRTQWQAPEVDGIVIINDVVSDDGSALPDISQYYNRFAQVEITEFKGYDLVGKVSAIL